MHLFQNEDPRDLWARARRLEVVRHAHALGHTDIVEQMPKDLAVRILKSRGVPPPSVPPRPIGNVDPRLGDTTLESHRYVAPQAEAKQEVETISAEDVLMREWQARKAQEQEEKPLRFTDLRRMCKDRGIKYLRTDTAEQLKARLHGQDAAE